MIGIDGGVTIRGDMSQPTRGHVGKKEFACAMQRRMIVL
jgi:hypothetical protein